MAIAQTPKPSSGLPARGTVVGGWEAGPTKSVEDHAIFDYQRRRIYDGYYDYRPDLGGRDRAGGSAESSAPSPTLNFRYLYEIQRKYSNSSFSVWEPTPVQAGTGRLKWGTVWIDPYAWTFATPQSFNWLPPIPKIGLQGEHSTGQGDGGGGPATRGPVSSSSSSSSSDTTKLVNINVGPMVLNPPLHDYARSTSPMLGGKSRNSKQGQQKGLIMLDQTKVQQSVAVGRTKNWAFRFLYNPMEWSYEATMDPDAQTPEGREASDSPDFSAGSMNYSFSMYLNRVPDLALNAKKLYNPQINDADWKEIQARGTEYDIDFLFRVINGDPEYADGATGKRLTANRGVLGQARVRLSLGGAFSKEGYISGIRIRHFMMTPAMIPTMSQIDISFTQYLAVKGETAP